MDKLNLTKVQTKKRKKIISLPAIRSYIYQPNRITNAIYDYSLIQERIFNAVIYYLQEPIKLSLKGEDYGQYSLFQEYKEQPTIKITIPLREITIPQHYDQVKKSIKQLASIVVEIPYINQKTQEKRVVYKGLLSADIPSNSTRNSLIYIEVDKRVAKLLVEIDQNKGGQPINYTRYVYEIAQNASNKYTSRVYKLICSWRKKGGFTIPLEDFRKWLGIEDKYKYFADIKKNILLPVQNELFEKADCWFNCKSDDFVTKQGNTVTHLNFKIITPELIVEEDKRKDYAFNLLRTHFKFNDRNIEQIRPLFNKASSEQMLLKIVSLREYYLNNVTKITDVVGYVIKSLQNEFGDNESNLF
ncbi:MAG: replication initiation protein [Bacteroidota bacterium]|nr:replication initiation protein [Bacteroidota bacterium]